MTNLIGKIIVFINDKNENYVGICVPNGFSRQFPWNVKFLNKPYLPFNEHDHLNLVGENIFVLTLKTRIND